MPVLDFDTCTIYCIFRIYSICASATILKVAKCLANIVPHGTRNRCFGASGLAAGIQDWRHLLKRIHWAEKKGIFSEESAGSFAGQAGLGDWWDQAFSCSCQTHMFNISIMFSN